jgi:hypothetical protein
MQDKHIIENLGNNLILRRSTPEDCAALAKFNGTIHVAPGEDLAEYISQWIQDLFSGRHPTFNVDDFTIIEDTGTGEIVSCLCLIDQTWSYEGIQFPVGRTELVSTHPDYRRRGLVRKQFDVVHQWSEERGHKAQFITGIPWYYRQFGYEMAVNLGGSRFSYLPVIPRLKDDQKEQFIFREAAEKDIHFLTELYAYSTQRSMLSCVRDEAIWLYELTGRTPKSALDTRIHIIEDLSGKSVGYFIVAPTLHGGTLNLWSYELAEGVSWLSVTPTVLRKLQDIGEAYAERDTTEENKSELKTLAFRLGEDHPAYHVNPRSLPLVNPSYAYYMRVPDLPDFLMTIRPVLEERLTKSYAVGYSGELKLNFFKDGLILTFEDGKLKSVEIWEKPEREVASALFPDLTFLQLLLGYRSYDELNEALPDCYSYNNDAKVLLRILFPKKPSRVYDLG